jgi:osmotically-inducible protein OsmY
MGVRGVSDQIAIKPTLSSTVVKEDIEAALKRGAHTEAQHIDVVIRGTDVILTGTVRSWSERELATQSAWGAIGVRKVINNLAVGY